MHMEIQQRKPVQPFGADRSPAPAWDADDGGLLPGGARGPASRLRSTARWARSLIADRSTGPLALVALGLLAFAATEGAVSAATNSLGLATAALHTLFDGACVAIGLAAAVSARGGATPAFSYGRQRLEVLAGFANGVFLVFFSLFVCVEAAQRLMLPQEMHEHEQALWTACAGLVVHLASALFFRQHLAIRAEVRGDAPDTVAVLVINALMDAARSGVVLLATWASRGNEGSMHYADPLASLLLSVLAVYHTFPVIFRTGRVMLQATPATVRQQLYGALLRARMVEGVLEVKEEHFWTLAPGVFVGSVVVRVRSDAAEQTVRQQVRSLLAGFVSHLTVQVEKDSWVPTFN